MSLLDCFHPSTRALNEALRATRDSARSAGSSAFHAWRMSRLVRRMAIAEAKKSGRHDWGPDAGDRLTSQDWTGKAGWLDYLLSEGVTISDIYTWWNQYEVVRQLADILDNIAKIELYSYLRDSGVSESLALERTRKSHATYSCSLSSWSKSRGLDDPIPAELRPRVQIFLMKKLETSTRVVGNESDPFRHGFSSMNAWLRAMTKSGQL